MYSIHHKLMMTRGSLAYVELQEKKKKTDRRPSNSFHFSDEGPSLKINDPPKITECWPDWQRERDWPSPLVTLISLQPRTPRPVHLDRPAARAASALPLSHLLLQSRTPAPRRLHICSMIWNTFLLSLFSGSFMHVDRAIWWSSPDPLLAPVPPLTLSSLQLTSHICASWFCFESHQVWLRQSVWPWIWSDLILTYL